jgi:c-di-GMP-binding flagellar brake protein YcgR
MGNHRKQHRVPLDIFMNKYVAGVPYMARAADISSEGMGLARLIEPNQSGARVGLQFQLPGSEEVIYAEGEVVRDWAEAGNPIEGSGVRFTLITERHKRLIEQYVARSDQ